MAYFDSHAHLGEEQLYANIDTLALRAKDCGVENILNICTNVETLHRGLAIRKKYPWIYTAAATTPHDAAKEGREVFPLIEEHARGGYLDAIGETGLDYYYYGETKGEQKELLRRYLRLALECKLPVVIHCRDAFADFFEILDEEYQVDGIHAPGVLHCFTGTLEEAQEVIRRGWFLSFSGIVTFKKSVALQEVARWVPVEQLLIETDAPYLAPQSKRGKLNEPSYVQETAACIATLKGIHVDDVARHTTANAFRFLNKQP